MSAPAPTLVDPALEALAPLFEYPRGDHLELVRHARTVLARDLPDAAAALAPLEEHCRLRSRSECEEEFVHTFDFNPACALEIGWQLYGEQYARGAFLVRTQELMREAGVEPNTELADHLPNVLRILARLQGPSALKLARRFTLTAVQGMHGKLAGARAESPYLGLLSATANVIEHRFEGEVADE